MKNAVLFVLLLVMPALLSLSTARAVSVPAFVFSHNDDGQTYKLTFTYADDSEVTNYTTDAGEGTYTISDYLSVFMTTENNLTNTYVSKVVIDKSFYSYKPTSWASWFSGMRRLSTIEGLQYLNTSEATSMNHMFSNCVFLSSIDIDWNTEKVTDMQFMFYGCTALKRVDMSGCKTPALKRPNSMFDNCTNLTYLNIQNFDFSNVEGLTSMFGFCRNLTTLFIGGSTINRSAQLFANVGQENRTCYLYVNEDFDTSVLGEEIPYSPYYNYIWMGGHFKVIQMKGIGIYVNGTQLYDQNISYAIGNGHVDYDPNSNTLTLDNVTLASNSTGYGVLIQDMDDLTLSLCGSTTLSGAMENDAIRANNTNLTIVADTAGSTLNLYQTSGNGIQMYASDGGSYTLSIQGKAGIGGMLFGQNTNALVATGNVSLQIDDAAITLVSTGAAISGFSSVSLNGLCRYITSAGDDYLEGSTYNTSAKRLENGQGNAALMVCVAPVVAQIGPNNGAATKLITTIYSPSTPVEKITGSFLTSGSISFNHQTNTLLLEDAAIDCDTTITDFLTTYADFRIQAEGNNFIRCFASNRGSAIHSYSSTLTIRGAGMLALIGGFNGAWVDSQSASDYKCIDIDSVMLYARGTTTTTSSRYIGLNRSIGGYYKFGPEASVVAMGTLGAIYSGGGTIAAADYLQSSVAYPEGAYMGKGELLDANGDRCYYAILAPKAGSYDVVVRDRGSVSNGTLMAAIGYDNMMAIVDSGTPYTAALEATLTSAGNSVYRLSVGDAYAFVVAHPEPIVPVAVLDDYRGGFTKLTFTMARQSQINGEGEGQRGTYALNEGNDKPGWMKPSESPYVLSIIIDDRFAEVRPTSMAYWFCATFNNSTYTGFNEYLNTSEVTSMHQTFAFSGITDVNITTFDMGKVTDVDSMFFNCTKLRFLRVGNNDFTGIVDYSVANINQTSNVCGWVGSESEPCTLVVGPGFDLDVLTFLHEDEADGVVQWLGGYFKVKDQGGNLITGINSAARNDAGSDPSNPSFDSSAPAYTLDGQPAPADYKGIVIQGGKKILRK